MEALDASAVQEVERIAREAQDAAIEKQYAVREIQGRTYANLTGFSEVMKLVPEPGPLKLSTLQSLVDYVRDDPDHDFTDGRDMFLHIESPTMVSYWSGADGPYLRRATVAVCEAESPKVGWGSQWSVEQFLTAIRTLFVKTPAVDQIVDFLSCVDTTNAIRQSDDGMSQLLTVNRGVRGKAEVKIPNPILLQPYRTFAAVTQPESPFLMRLHDQGPGQLPKVSLTEADLGQWRLAAVVNIKTFLTDANLGCGIYG